MPDNCLSLLDMSWSHRGCYIACRQSKDYYSKLERTDVFVDNKDEKYRLMRLLATVDSLVNIYLASKAVQQSIITLQYNESHSVKRHSVYICTF